MSAGGHLCDGRFRILATHTGSASSVNVWVLAQYEDGTRKLRGVHPSLARVGREIDTSRTHVEVTNEEEEALSRLGGP